MRTSFLSIAILMIGLQMLGQSRIPVASLSLRLLPNKDTTLYFGFAQGDEIVLNYASTDLRKIALIEIAPYGAAPIMTYRDVERLRNEKINVVQKGVYTIHFSNSSPASPRSFDIDIHRKAASDESKWFNTAVHWQLDTLWSNRTEKVIVGYDSVLVQKTRMKLVNTDTLEQLILEKIETVAPYINMSSDHSEIPFSLPKDIETATEKKRLIAWAYSIGVDAEFNKAWEQAGKNIHATIHSTISRMLSPLGAFALGIFTDVIVPTNGEKIDYLLLTPSQYIDYKNDKPFLPLDKGTGILSFKRFVPNLTARDERDVGIVLHNKNWAFSVNVTIKVVAIVEHKKYREEIFNVWERTPIYEDQIKRVGTPTKKFIPLTTD